jgi:hypothetical protein
MKRFSSINVCGAQLKHGDFNSCRFYGKKIPLMQGILQMQDAKAVCGVGELRLRIRRLRATYRFQ